MQILHFDENHAYFLFKKLRKYIRKKDIDLYFKCKALNKSDIDFLEQMSLIHLKNISLDSKINQNLYGVLDDFIFNTLFTKHFFSTFEMFRIFLYRLKAPKKLILSDVKFHLRKFLKYDMKHIDKKGHNAIYLLEPLPSIKTHIESFLNTATEILQNEKVQNIIINPLNLLLNPYLMNQNSSNQQSTKEFIKEFSKSLRVLLNNLNAKMLTIDNEIEFFDEILQCVEECVGEIGYPVSVALSVPSYYLDSKKMLESVISASERLIKSNKARLIVRIKDVDINYAKQAFIAKNNHKPSIIFSNPNTSKAHFLSLLKICAKNTESIEYFLFTQDIFVLSLLNDKNSRLEINKSLNFPLYTLAKKQNFALINTQFFTTHFTDVLTYFLKSSLFTLNHNLFSLLNMHFNAKEWERGCENFLNILESSKLIESSDIKGHGLERFKDSKNMEFKGQKIKNPESINGSTLPKSHILLDFTKPTSQHISPVESLQSSTFKESTFNFETFDFELQKPISSLQSFQSLQTSNFKAPTEDSKDLKSAYHHVLLEESLTTPYAHHFNGKSLDSSKDFINLSKPKLEDMLYLNSDDMHRLSLLGLHNTPLKFSLNAKDEERKIELAHKKYDEMLQNRLNIITLILAQLKENLGTVFRELKYICSDAPKYMLPEYVLEEQVYMLLDTFRFYAYEYKRLLGQTDSVLIMHMGIIFVETRGLHIHEIASIIAANIMAGNVTILSECALSRVLYRIFEPILESCTFLTIANNDNLDSTCFKNLNQNLYRIISKNDFFQTQENQSQINLLTWHRGSSVVFISSFYNLYEAYFEVAHMRFWEGNFLNRDSINKAIKTEEIIIYTDEYIYDDAKQAFALLDPSLNVTQISLGELVLQLENNQEVSNLSLFTYNKAEMNYALGNVRISMRINAGYRYKLLSGSPRIFSPGYLPPFGSPILLTKLVLTSPNNMIRNNSLYSDIISCFSMLSFDEIEFLYNLNHNYSEYLATLKRPKRADNIYEFKLAYDMTIRVYRGDDFFHICVIMLIAFLLDIKTKVSFEVGYFVELDSKDSKDSGAIDKISDIENPKTKSETSSLAISILEILKSNLKEKRIDIFTFKVQSEEAFLNNITSLDLIRILREEQEFSGLDSKSSDFRESTHAHTYKALRKKGIIAEYSLPILNKNLELEKYLATQYIHIEPNFLLETNIND